MGTSPRPSEYLSTIFGGSEEELLLSEPGPSTATSSTGDRGLSGEQSWSEYDV